MSEEHDKELLRLAEAVSDGTPVDWERERGSHPGMKQPLDHLALLDRVRQVHEESSRVLIETDRTASRPEASPRGPAPAPAPERARGRIVWIAIAVLLAAAALAIVVYRLYNSATNAAM
jgi:hypothetical protein